MSAMDELLKIAEFSTYGQASTLAKELAANHRSEVSVQKSELGFSVIGPSWIAKYLQSEKQDREMGNDRPSTSEGDERWQDWGEWFEEQESIEKDGYYDLDDEPEELDDQAHEQADDSDDD